MNQIVPERFQLRGSAYGTQAPTKGEATRQECQAGSQKKNK